MPMEDMPMKPASGLSRSAKRMVTKVSESCPVYGGTNLLGAIFKMSVRKVGILQSCVCAPTAGRRRVFSTGALHPVRDTLRSSTCRIPAAVHVL